MIISPNDPDCDGPAHRRSAGSAGTPSWPTRPSSWPGCPARTISSLIDGAAYLVTNEYEKELLESKTGLTDAQVLDRVGIRITTLGKYGVRITGRDIDTVEVPVAQEIRAYDPTGVGDGFRSGFFAARSWGLPLERCAQVGSLLATLVLETVGTQEYDAAHRPRSSSGSPSPTATSAPPTYAPIWSPDPPHEPQLRGSCGHPTRAS